VGWEPVIQLTWMKRASLKAAPPSSICRCRAENWQPQQSLLWRYPPWGLGSSAPRGWRWAGLNAGLCHFPWTCRHGCPILGQMLDLSSWVERLSGPRNAIPIAPNRTNAVPKMTNAAVLAGSQRLCTSSNLPFRPGSKSFRADERRRSAGLAGRSERDGTCSRGARSLQFQDFQKAIM